MKKILLVLLLSVLFISFVGCKKTERERDFLNKMTNVSSYKVEGVLETYYNSVRKQNDFTVYYKNPNLIKVVLANKENADKQIILKNTEGVYVLVPAVNKNFKIKSTWPENASYPYLLQSLAKDIANDSELIKSEDVKTYSVETKTKMHADATAVTQKIIFSKETNLPTEVLVYDENADLYIRCVFSKISLGETVSDDEFKVEKSMEVVRTELGENGIVYEREVKQPSYIPAGTSLIQQSTTTNVGGTQVRSITKYGGEKGFTIIQEYVNDRDLTYYQEEIGEIIIVMGNFGIQKTNSVQMIFEGIEYTIASNNMEIEELLKVAKSYIAVDEGK